MGKLVGGGRALLGAVWRWWSAWSSWSAVVGRFGLGPVGPAGPGAAVGREPGSGGIGPAPPSRPGWLTLYQQAAATCPGLSWSVLAAVGTVETGQRAVRPRPGCGRGPTRPGPRGPCSSSRPPSPPTPPSDPGGARPPSPYDPVDAVYTAAALLCADGAGSAATLRAAIEDYNHSDPYVNTVLTLSLAFGDDPSTLGHGGGRPHLRRPAAGHPLPLGRHRRRRVRLLGPGPGRLRARAGIALPRVAQEPVRRRAGRPAAARPSSPGTSSSSAAARPASTTSASTWAPGEMIDAPHTGALVRFDDAGWSGLVGATRPG